MICLPGLKCWGWWPVSVVFWFSCHWWIGKTQSSGNVKSSREFYLISSTGKVWPCTSFFRNWYRYYVFQFLNELKIYLRQNIAIKLSEECTGINWSFKTRGFCLLMLIRNKCPFLNGLSHLKRDICSLFDANWRFWQMTQFLVFLFVIVLIANEKILECNLWVLRHTS